MTALPINTEAHVDFLAKLKERAEPIEKLRNCIAHNRTVVPPDLLESFNFLKVDLLASINTLFQNTAATAAPSTVPVAQVVNPAVIGSPDVPR